MKRLALAITAAGTAVAFWKRGWVLCFVRRRHNPLRYPLGGFKCADCGKSGADLGEMGVLDGGYIRGRRFARER